MVCLEFIKNKSLYKKLLFSFFYLFIFCVGFCSFCFAVSLDDVIVDGSRVVDDLYGYCEVSGVNDEDVILVEYIWYKNDEVFLSDSYSYLGDGVKQVNHIGFIDTSEGDEFNLSCRAIFGVQTTDWENISISVLGDGSPVGTYLAPVVTYMGKLDIDLGYTVNTIVTVRNSNPISQWITLELKAHSSSNPLIENWIWFEGYKNDMQRTSLNLFFEPHERKIVSVNVMGGFEGDYGFVLNASNDIGGLSSDGDGEYVPVSIKIRHGVFYDQVPGPAVWAIILILIIILFGLFGRLFHSE
jgi:hypothetical protein